MFGILKKLPAAGGLLNMLAKSGVSFSFFYRLDFVGESSAKMNFSYHATICDSLLILG